MKILEKCSKLKFDSEGNLSIHLNQLFATNEDDCALIGSAQNFNNTQLDDEEDSTEFRKQVLNQVHDKEGALDLFSFYPGARASREHFDELKVDVNAVVHAGITNTSDAESCKNQVYIRTGDETYVQDKISLSAADRSVSDARRTPVNAGDTLHYFTAADDKDEINWVVLNCHDYTDTSILLELLKRRVELIVIIAHNPDWRLFWEYARSDVHRLFCYVTILNVGDIGGSAVFGPYKSRGKERTGKLGFNTQLFGSRGPGKMSSTVKVNIRELRKDRQGFSETDFGETKIGESSHTSTVGPSQHFTKTNDIDVGAPNFEVQDVNISWEMPDKPRIAVAQLHSIERFGRHHYWETGYRLSSPPILTEADKQENLSLVDKTENFSDIHEKYCRYLDAYIDLLSSQEEKIDFLLMPEVIAPREWAEDRLERFSRDNKCVVVCGVDYPTAGNSSDNANECLIFIDGQQHVYRKITRSQYDAMNTDGKSRLTLQRGNTIKRFIDPNKRSFAVLICYDFSHLDLLHRVNWEKRQTPLDLLLVSAYNPYGELYKSCCVADSHRFYQYIALANEAKYGGSGVYGPVRVPGARQTLLHMGKQANGISVVEVDLAGLIEARLNLKSGVEPQEIKYFKRLPGSLTR